MGNVIWKYGKRDMEVKTTVDIGCQFLVQNTHSDRQMKLKPMHDVGFTHTVETPLSVALPLTLHQRMRDKNLIVSCQLLTLEQVMKTYSILRRV